MTKEFITVIDYGSGNLRSAAKACAHAAADYGLDLEVIVSDKAEDIARASHLILPGQGAFGDCMRGLEASGLIEPLEDAVLRRRVPFLGICVGMQLLAREGHEHGNHKGLGWLDATVEPLQPSDPALKIPHMGWNDVQIHQDHPVLQGIEAGAHFYFVHSYQMQLGADSQALLLSCDYGGPVVGAVAFDNIVGVQFHPEKSAEAGLRLISNFLTWQV